MVLDVRGHVSITCMFLHLLYVTGKKKTQPTYVCYIDFSRAFDSIHRSLLWYKLACYNITGKLLNVINTYVC